MAKKDDDLPLMAYYLIGCFFIWIFWSGWIAAVLVTIGLAFQALLAYAKTLPETFDMENLFEWPGTGDYEVDVVGESYYQKTLLRLFEQSEKEYVAVLKPEDDNEYDKKAVAVLIEGFIVGHLDRDDARSFRRRLGRKKLSGQPTKCRADLTGGYQMKNGRQANVGVVLDMEPFD